MKVLTIYDKSGPKYHRCLLPCYLMPGIELIVNYSINETQLEGVDILFINRIAANTSLQNLLDLRKKYGFKLIIDFDDHWELDADHYLFHSYQEHRLPDLMRAYILEADGITVTHERLWNQVQLYNSNCHILPNAIPNFDQFLVKKKESNYTRLFWAGGVTHKKDIQLLCNPVKRFNFKDIEMVLGGYTKNNPEYMAMASAYTNGGRLRNNLIESLPVDQYYYSYSECDIALVPLRGTIFNSYKSNLKILEAANISSPVVVSNVNPYKNFPDELVNYVNSQGDWYKQVKKLIDSPGMAKYQGEMLKAYCDEHFNFTKINKERKQFFEYVTGKSAKAGEIQGALQQLETVPISESSIGR